MRQLLLINARRSVRLGGLSAPCQPTSPLSGRNPFVSNPAQPDWTPRYWFQTTSIRLRSGDSKKAYAKKHLRKIEEWQRGKAEVRGARYSGDRSFSGDKPRQFNNRRRESGPPPPFSSAVDRLKIPDYMKRTVGRNLDVFVPTPNNVRKACQVALDSMGTEKFTRSIKPLCISKTVITTQLEEFKKRFKAGQIPDLHWENLVPIISDQKFASLEHRFVRAFMDHLLTVEPAIPATLLGELPLLKRMASLNHPLEWYPQARRISRKIIMHVGPTNSGKTHHALKRLESARRGIYCGPLRLLAFEIYERMNHQGIGCNLITGEDRRLAEKDVPLLSATIEMADFNAQYDVAVLDEIQMIGDTFRGHAWTDALLGLRAREVHLCGEPSAVPLVKRMMEEVGDEVEVIEYQRLSRMELATDSLQGDLTRLRRGDCLIAFSRKGIYQLKEYIEANTEHKCSVIYGSLPPETRAQQARLFNDPESPNTVLVASDAIGMGINLSIGRVIFTAVHKFNGIHITNLSLSSTRQIAGRAGRFGTEFNPGFATTVLERDMPFLRDSIPTLPPLIGKAVVAPRVHQLEKFAHQVPQLPFTQMLNLLEIVADLGPDYTLGDIGLNPEDFDFLDHLPMSVADKFMMSFAPIVTREPTGSEICKRMIRFHAYNQECYVSDLLSLPEEVPLGPGPLQLLEIYHKCLTCYLWLSFKFPATFVDHQEALESKIRCESMIEACLETMIQAEKKRALEIGDLAKVAHLESKMKTRSKPPVEA